MKQRLFLAGILLTTGAGAQTISGTVSAPNREPLAGASVYWMGSRVGATTNAKGAFVLEMPTPPAPKLIASYVGYRPDTLDVQSLQVVAFVLKEQQSASEVTVRGQREGIFISSLLPVKTEQITQAELRKSACCDLAGCFETQTTVQPQTTNVITNAKELRILGLSGVYNQVLVDGFPMIQGLTYTYGISSIPGTLVDNIYVSKGANSVLQGFEGMSGQINVETKDPDKTDRLLLNAYVNSFAEKHVNASYAFKQGKWSNLTALHTVQPARRTDRDDDQFLDLPLLTRYLVVNKWKYGNEKNWGWSSRVGIRYLNEQRIGGQTTFNADTDKGSNRVYGQQVGISQPEIWTKTGYRLNDRHYFVAFGSAVHQRQDSYFGTVKYNARQQQAYVNLQHELNYGKSHQLKSGLSYRHLRLQEDIGFTDNSLQRTYAGRYLRVEHIAGFFAENTMQFLNGKLTWMAGLRGDHHQQFGFRLTPRTLLKYDITPKTVVRASAGSGWRTVNLFSENIGLLVSSRDIIFAEPLQPETSVNYGINITRKFGTEDRNLAGYISADFYRTTFGNQIFPDYDTDPTRAFIRNFTGTSISNGFQAELYLSLFRRFELKSGFNVLDVYRKTGNVKQLLPFNPRQKVLTTFSYKPLSARYHFDMNVHWYGRQRLPDTRLNPVAFQRPDFSPTYTVVNAQFTYSFKKSEVYIGCENLFDFRQLRPIISWQNPFGPHFDTSSVWGPTRGRELYAGFRFKITRE